MTTVVFDRVDFRESRNGPYIFFTQSDGVETAVGDIAFKDSLAPEIEAIGEGQSVSIVCEVPRNRTKPGQWRIHSQTYMARDPGTAAMTHSLEKSLKCVTVELDIEYHQLLKEMHGQYKLMHDDCPRFGDFLKKLLTHQLEPFRWSTTTPF